MSIKLDRVNSELQRQISRIIANDIKDPRIGSSLIGVTKVKTTPDLRFAKVYLSVLAADEESRKAAFDTVVRSKTFIRNMLKDAVQIRLLPDLNFALDDSVDYGDRIEKILMNIDIPKDEQ